MIFKPELVRAIQQGKKSMTRRPVRPGEKSCRYQPGRVYAIKPGRTKPASLQVTIGDDVRREWVGCISLEDARREGFRTRAEFLAYWHRLYGPPATAGMRHLEKQLAELDPEEESEARAIEASIEEMRRIRSERLPLPAVPCLVWVIPFVKGDRRDVPRLLRSGAPQAPVCTSPLRGPDGKVVYKPGGRKKVALCNRAFREGQEVCECGAHRPPETGEDHGYTARDANKMSNEPEAIAAADTERFAKEALDRPRVSERQVFLEERETIMEALRKLRAHTDSRAVNSDLRLIEKRLSAIDRKLERDAA